MAARSISYLLLVVLENFLIFPDSGIPPNQPTRVPSIVTVE